jgi:hypothetical protein
MEVVHPRCAGLDVSKRDVKVCVRIQGRGSRPTRANVTTWGSTTRQILALRDMLVEEGVGSGDGVNGACRRGLAAGQGFEVAAAGQ